MLNWRSLLLVTAALWASACPTRIPRPANALDDADAIVKKANDRLASLTSISVYARVWQGDILMAAPVRMDLIGKRPDRLYFSILDPTQNMLGALASDGTTFTSFQRGQSSCLTGPACKANVGRLLPLSLEPRDIVSVLMGGAPTLSGVVSKTVEWDQRAGAYCIILKAADGSTQWIWITHTTWLTQRTRVADAKGKTVIDIKFDDVKKVDGKPIAHQIDVLVPKSKTKTIRIVYKEVELDDEELTEDAFKLECPKGATPTYLPCPVTSDPMVPPAKKDGASGSPEEETP